MKGKNNMSDELLKEIANHLGFEYLSDLRYMSNQVYLERALYRIPLDKYEVEEWINAAEYLGFYIDQSVKDYTDAGETRDYLINRIAQEKSKTAVTRG